MVNNKDNIDIQKMYGDYFYLNKDDFIKKYNINLRGLSDDEVSQNIDKYGLNEIKETKSKKWYHYLLKSLLSPFSCILLGICFVLFYTDVMLPQVPNYANIIVILVLVTVSTLLEFFEEFKSNKAAEKLKELVATTVSVLRNGTEVQIPVNQITVGDIVLLSAGSIIPADLRIIETNNLYVGQSALTGESESVKKLENTESKTNSIEDISVLDTIAFMGTNVISGSAKGIVIKVGNDTFFGNIAKSFSDTQKTKSAFESGISSISNLLIKFMLILIPIVFFINAWKHESITAFTFAVAIAIGITPLLLPVILASSLSRGAIRMSKKKVIVKKLDSIQNFGSMNILCTDKTGTLTEDRIVLEKYLDVYGNENIEILKTVFLNSYFQNGIKSNIDLAIIESGNHLNINTFAKNYIKVDEIPFDFTRRRLSVIVNNHNEIQMVTKGALEEILSISTTVKDANGNLIPLNKEFKTSIRNICNSLNSDGFRVLAVSIKNNLPTNTNFTIKSENNMTLLGFVGFLDPPKKSAKISIENLNNSGVRVIVLTGDNLEVTKYICKQLNINSHNIILGSQIDKLSDMAIMRLLKKTNIFAKLSPIQKARLVRILRESGNSVGYMGDGINDGPSLNNSDVSISVDTGADIAKEAADIILLEKDLNVLLDGAKEGRKTFTNLMKYIKMAVSFNFGEVSSVIIASIFLPFLPITPIQLLVQSLLYDFGQLTLPYDNVDPEYLEKPQVWSLKSLKHFMLFMGPLSSIFDMIVFSSIWFIFGVREAAIFQTIWFSYGVVSNLIGMHVIRTAKLPFVQSNASKIVYFSSITLSLTAIIVPFTFIGKIIGLVPISLKYLAIIIGVPILYCFVALFAKKIYIRKYGEWI